MAEAVAKGGRNLAGIAFDGDGKLYVTGASDGRVYAEEGGSLVEAHNLGGAPCGVAIDHVGAMFIADQARAGVFKVSEDGEPVAIVSEYEGQPFKGPHTILFDSANSMFFTDPGPYGETSIAAPRGSVYAVTGPEASRILRPIALDCLAFPTGIALNPTESVLYICEQSANRVLRLTQRPTGVWHPTVFFQFAGRLGPIGIVCDHSRGGLLYVARPESPELSEKALITVLSPEGALLRDIEVPGPEISCLAISPDSRFLYYCESTTNTIYRLPL